MSSNTFGRLFRFTTFGESHGSAIGVVVDGCPAGIAFDRELLVRELQRRRPGQSKLTTPRDEPDVPVVLSGVYDDKTTGAPIAVLVYNRDQRSKDYEALKDVFRPSHADYTWWKKYGIRDHRGGGRASARETVGRVIAGAIAKMVLRPLGVRLTSYTRAIGPIQMPDDFTAWSEEDVEQSPVRCPHPKTTEQMVEYIEALRRARDTTGGIIECRIQYLPVGLGEPIYDKFHARLAYAMMSIPSVKGFELGGGFAMTQQKGSEVNDPFEVRGGMIHTRTNYSGGVQGGITNGEDVVFRVAFKPISSIGAAQKTITTKGQETEIRIEGRHDPCVVVRAHPIVEAMAAVVSCDFLLLHQSSRLRL